MRWLFALVFVGGVLAPTPALAAPSSEGAIEWAMARTGQHDWDGWCLKFVRGAFQGRSSADDAYKFYVGLGQPNTGAATDKIPRGALVFFGPTPTNPYGHVAIALGGGRMIGALLGQLSGIQTTSITYVRNYVGWANPPVDWIGREPAAPVTASPSPSPAAVATTVPPQSPLPTPAALAAPPGPTPAAPATSRPTPTTYAVRGRVTSAETGAGLAGLRVYGYSLGPGGTGSEGGTDANGNYVLRLPQGTYNIDYGLVLAGGGYGDNYWCPGNSICQPRGAVPSPNFVVSGDVNNVDVALVLCAPTEPSSGRFAISGVVTNSSRAPIARAFVLAYVPGQESYGVRACTDSSGAFTVRVNAGVYVLVVGPPSGAPFYYTQVWKDLNYVGAEGPAPVDRATRITVSGDVGGITPMLVPYSCSSSRTKTFCNP